MPQLILLPGLAADATMWRDQLTELAEFSPMVTDVHARHDTIEGMASALLEEHPADLVLCGASMGGIIAMEAVRQAPSRVRALALLGTTPRPENDEMRRLREEAIVRFSMGQVREVIEPNVAFAFYAGHPAIEKLAVTYLDFVLAAGAQQLIRQNQAIMARPDARKHLPAVGVPTLVMCGENDMLTPPDCASEIASLIPGAQLVMVPECGHMITMEKPEVVNAHLREWLASL